MCTCPSCHFSALCLASPANQLPTFPMELVPPSSTAVPSTINGETSSPSRQVPKSSVGKTLGILLVLALVVGALSFFALKWRSARSNQQASVPLEQAEGSNQAQNKEIAKKIVEEVKTHFQIAAGIEPAVAAVVDVTLLRKQNDFYNKAENGDYLVLTPERAILWRPSTKMIIDVVPVPPPVPSTAEQE